MATNPKLTPKPFVFITEPGVGVRPTPEGGQSVAIDEKGNIVSPSNIRTSGGWKVRERLANEQARLKAEQERARLEREAKEIIAKREAQEAQLEKAKIIEAKKQLQQKANAQTSTRILTNQQNQKIREEIVKANNQRDRVIVRTNLVTGEKTYSQFVGGRKTAGVTTYQQSAGEIMKIKNILLNAGLNPVIQAGQIIGFKDKQTNKFYNYTKAGIDKYNKFVAEQTDKDKQTARKNATKTAVKKYFLSGGVGVVSPEDLQKAGQYISKKGEDIASYARKIKLPRTKSEDVNKAIIKDVEKDIKFLLGAGSEVVNLVGGILQLPALTVSIIENPAIALSIPPALLEGVKQDLIRIKNIPKSDAVSAGGASVTALTYILPAVKGTKYVKAKFKLRNRARLTPEEINKIKYVTNKRLLTLEKTLKQRGVRTKISGTGVAKTKTGSITESKYRGIMRIGKRDATILQSSTTRLKNGVVYNTISEVKLKFGQKKLPVPVKVGKNYVFIKQGGKLVKVPFSKIKYTSRELISWVKDSRGKVTANIFGELKDFKNVQSFKKYISTKHGIKTIKGLYSNPNIKNMPTRKGISYAYQKKIGKTLRADGAEARLYKTSIGTVRKKIFRPKTSGRAVEIKKTKKIQQKLYGKSYTLPKDKRTPLSRTFGSTAVVQKQQSVSKIVPPSRFVPQATRTSFNKLVLNSKSAKAIQKSLARGVTLSVIGSSLIARLPSGKLASLKKVSNLSNTQLNKQLNNLKTEVRPATKQVIIQKPITKTRQQTRQQTKQETRQQTRQQTKQQTRQLTRQQTAQLTRQLTRQQTRQLTRGGIRPKIITPEEPKPTIPRIVLGGFTPVTLSRPVQTFYVVEKVRGKFRKLYPQSLTIKDARDYAVYTIDNRLSKTAFFIPAGKSKKVFKTPKEIENYYSMNSRKVRPYRIRYGKKRDLVNGFIEKRKYFQDTAGERLQARRLKSKPQRYTKSIPRRRTSKRKLTPAQRKVLLKRLEKARRFRMAKLRRKR